MKPPELTVVHRVCPALSRNAAGFPDKESLVRACSVSLFAALRGVRTRLFVLLDGCPPDWRPRLGEAFEANRREDGSTLEFVPTDSLGNRPTFRRQIELLAADGDRPGGPAPVVCFSEDDYLYRPGAFRVLREAALAPGFDFVTPLDHPDRYGGAVEEPRETEIRLAAGRHWRRTGTTCLTFLARREVFLAARRRLDAYACGMDDAVMWLGLTKEGTFRPGCLLRSAGALLRRAVRGRPAVGYGAFLPLLAWRAHGARLLLSRRFRLWSPVPTLAVHCCSNSLPPGAEDVPGWPPAE